MFGPLRSCMYPKTFRSTNVRKATASRIGTISEIMLIVNMMLGRGFEPLGIKV